MSFARENCFIICTQHTNFTNLTPVFFCNFKATKKLKNMPCLLIGPLAAEYYLHLCLIYASG